MNVGETVENFTEIFVSEFEDEKAVQQPVKYANKYVDERCVISGDKVEYLSYSCPIRCDYEREYEVKRDESNAEKGKRVDNLARARQTVRRIIWANLTPHTKFLTLTTAQTCLDIKEFRLKLSAFLKALTRAGYDLSYLYVLERQKDRGIKEGNEGSLHAHLVVFNDEKIPLKVIKKAWKHGRTEIHILNSLKWQKDNGKYKKGEKVRDVGAYVCKYITKEAELEWGSRCFNCSIGLNRPIEYSMYCYGDENIGLVKDTEDIYYITKEHLLKCTKITYQNSKVIDYDINGTVIHQIIDYKQGVLKYGSY